MKVLLALFLLAFGVKDAFAQDASRPLNILLLVADDLGYADLGCYGGDIETPNLDALAKAGLRFSRFHAAPLCAVTRAMLLSGNDNHIAGMGRQGIRTGYEGYEGYLTDRVAPMPALLREAGYHTYIAGKWHLGTKPEHNPAQKGFEHSFVMLEGAANHYNNKNLFSPDENSPYTEDGVKTDWKEGDYSTEVYTDKLISFIDRHKDDGKPFFAFAAYTSPHWPLQVPEKYEAKYRGRYDAGYEVLKKSRFESLKRAGMIPTDAVLPQSHPAILPWDSLSKAEQRKEARKMELYAGMVDNLDEHIGRLIQYLKSIGQYDNTLIVFMSDNGAAAEDFYYNENYGPHLRTLFTDAYEDMGKPVSFNSYGPQWAEAGSSPFRYYKGFTTEGGMIAPMIVSGPMVKGRGEISHAFTTLMDIAPTAYALAQVKYPSLFNNKPVHALKGASLLPLLTGANEEVHGDDYVFGMEHGGYAMIKKGEWKIVNIERPFHIENFALYNLMEGLDEQKDLKLEAPEKFKELLREWEQFYKTNKVRIPTPKQGEGL
jgi:arylsulfatase A-like enzyme